VYFSNRSTRGRALLGAATLLLALLAILRALDPLPEGLYAIYFSDANWSSSRARSRIEPSPSTDSLLEAWGPSRPPEVFSTIWTGSFIALREGTYTFGTRSDDGAWVYVDGQLVVDDGGRHSALVATGRVHLDQGVHAIFIKYFQDGGSFHFDLLWARDAAPLELMPAWALSARHVNFSRFLASVVVRRAWAAVVVLWVVGLAVVGVAWLRRFLMRWISLRKDDPVSLVLVGVIIGSCALNLGGVWWGLPGSWAGDEFASPAVLEGLAKRFTGGWFDKYPPFHFYVLSAVYSPWLLLKSLRLIRVSDTFEFGALLLLGRLTSVIAGAGTLIAVYVCGADAFGKRAGLFAAATLAVLTPFLYFAKTANVEAPYVFWFALSLVFYVRFARTDTLRDAVLFSVATTLAVCTKDQAYGLYLPVPFVIAYQGWRSNCERRRSHPLLRGVLANGRLGLAMVTGAALFVACYQIPFNTAGFISHVRYITGPGSQPYRMVEGTLGGRLTLLRLAAGLDEMAWGWPMCLVCLIGMVAAVKDSRTRRSAVYLLLMAMGYYIGFIDVILYVYDRFLLPIYLMQSLFAGIAFDKFLRSPGGVRQIPRIALVATVFVYTFLYAATVDVLMIRDSRYTVERLLAARVGPDRLVGTMFPVTVLPRLGGLHSMDIGTIDALRQNAPAAYILNADYARAVSRDSPLGRLIAGLQQETLGYRLVFRYRSPAPWPWLPAPHHDLVGPRLETAAYSEVRNINPTIEIYSRESGGAVSPPTAQR
jgi:fibro-slime domain-containing protein